VACNSAPSPAPRARKSCILPIRRRGRPFRFALSAATGAPAERADSREAIAAAAKTAFARSGPSLIEIPVK
jgi:hypothetical protein